MLLWPALLGSLVGGWLGGPGLGAQGRQRVVLALPLGLSFFFTWALLLGLFLPPILLAGLVPWLAVGHGFWLGRHSAPPLGQPGWPHWLLAVLLGLVGWLFLVGGFQLAPPQPFLYVELPRIAQLGFGFSGVHPLGPEAGELVTPLATVLALGNECLSSSLALGGAAQVAAVLAWLWLSTRLHRRAPLAAVLGCLFLFMGAADAWLVTRLPQAGVGHLLAVMAWWLSKFRRPWPALPLTLGLACLDLQLAAALTVAALVPLKRKWELAAAGLMVGLYLAGPSLGLLAALVLWLRHPNHEVRRLAALEFFVPGLFGMTALGIALGRALTAVWRRHPGGRPGWSRQPQWSLSIPLRWLVWLVAALVVWRGLAPGEEVFNDEILIASQQQKVALEKLLVPRSLLGWAHWRGGAVGLAPADLEVARQLAWLKGSAVFSSGQAPESPTVAGVVSALAGGAPLEGWYVSKEGACLLPAVAAYAVTGQSELLRGTGAAWLLRRDHQPEAIEPWPDFHSELSALELERLEDWGRLLWFGTDGPASYQLSLDGHPFGPAVLTGGGSVPLVVPALAGHYQVEWSNGQVQPLTSPPSLPLKARLETELELPSRSLLPCPLHLTNGSQQLLDLSGLRGARLQLTSELHDIGNEVAPITPLEPFTLEPGASRTVIVYLRTPVPVGTFTVHLQLVDESEAGHPVNFSEPLVIRTWRRQPQVDVPDGVVRH
ncbi:MAG: hypothetical protein AB7S38_15810 [Vulcanimicrobiota bacterium]